MTLENPRPVLLSGAAPSGTLTQNSKRVGLVRGDEHEWSWIRCTR